MGRNKLGVSEHVPEPTKREVRRRCGFGCVLCGCAIVQYHHFDPPFQDAKGHDPHGITLLCGQCHDRVTRGILPDDVVRTANASPWCRKHMYTRDILFVGPGRIPIRIGTSRFRAESIAMFDDEIVLGLSQPECRGGPTRLNAVFTDPNGRETLRIVDNEWRVGVERFDVRTKGRVLTIRDGPEDEGIVLQMNLEARSELHIRKLRMQYRGFGIDGSDAGLAILAPGGARFVHQPSHDVIGEIGIWMMSTGEVLIAANRAGGAAICLGAPTTRG